MQRSLHRIVFGLGILALLVGSASAQLDLPAKSKKASPGTKEKTSRSKRGLDLPSRPVGDLAPGSEPQGLDLPRGKAGAEERPVPPPEPPTYEASFTGAAAFIFDELAKTREPNGGVARDAILSLVALGEPGLEAARTALGSDHAPTLVVGSRLLLRHGTAEDRVAVAERLRGRIPRDAAQPVLAELVERDPMLASPGYLVGLLDHRSGAMRVAVQRLLANEVGPEHLPLLATVLHAPRSDTRLRALELAARIDDPATLPMLLSRIGDEAPKTASRAADLLASREDESVERFLLDRAFTSEPIDRGGAYALLALIRIEERTGRSLLGDAHVPELVEAMSSSEPIVIGAAAAALAGVGFRSPSSREMAWLDLAVPHQLVRLSTGVVFHKDFASLQGPALRRLSLLSGKSFGTDGRAWQQWWEESARTFVARRAVIEVRPGDEAMLAIEYRAGHRPEDFVRLVGPGFDASQETAASMIGRRFFLTPRECGELVALLEREGVLGVERTPSPAGSAPGDARILDVSIGGQGKRFASASELDAAWFARVANAVLATAERNRWQLYRDPRYADQHAQWASESPWWEAEHTPRERDRRFVLLLVTALRSMDVSDRDDAVDELARLYEHEDVPSAGDFPAILDLLAEERFLGRRTEVLVDLALVSAAGTVPEPSAPGAPRIDPSLAARLADTLATALGDRGVPAVARALRAGGADLVREASSDERAFVRSVSATVLAEDSSPASREKLLALLDDPEPEVEAAAVLALGRHGIEEARNEILLRSRMASVMVRTAALLAAGEMGGDGVLDVLRLGLYEQDARVQMAAAEGLAQLADPESAGLLVRLFSEGRTSPFFEPAQRGLRRLGSAAWDELLRASFSAAEATRRDASLLLAEQGVPEVTTNLITILTKNPGDTRVAGELAVLTCADYREERDPAQSWWGWWDGVVHDSSLAWLCGAAERVGVSAPPVEELGAEGTLRGALFLLDLMGREPAHVAERARRELSTLVGGDVGTPPPAGPLRDEWLDDLGALVAERFADEGR